MKFAAQLIMICVVGVLALTFFSMSAGMTTGGDMSPCPYMEHDGVVCAKGVSEHLSSWKEAFIAIAPALLVALLTALLIGGFRYVEPTLPFIQSLLRLSAFGTAAIIRQLKERTYFFSYRAHQELFSNGILHPKLF